MAWIKKVYLYLVSLVSLIILIVACIMLINMALKTWVFTKADSDIYYTPQAMCDKAPVPTDGQQELDYNCLPENKDAIMEEETNRRSAQKQRDAAQALAMIIVATPVFLYHWKLARKEA